MMMIAREVCGSDCYTRWPAVIQYYGHKLTWILIVLITISILATTATATNLAQLTNITLRHFC